MVSMLTQKLWLRDSNRKSQRHFAWKGDEADSDLEGMKIVGSLLPLFYV